MGLKKTGIVPFNRDIFQEYDFLSSFVTDRPLAEPDPLALNESVVNSENVQQAMITTTPRPLSLNENNLKSSSHSPDFYELSTTLPTIPGPSKLCNNNVPFSPETVRPYPKAAARTTKCRRRLQKNKRLQKSKTKNFKNKKFA